MLYSELFESRIPDVLPEIYPQFPVPASEKTLNELFKQFNKLYFNNKLPSVPIKIKSRSGAFGMTTTELNLDTGKFDSLIEISPKILKNRRPVVDTLLHEMIHVYQNYKTFTTGDKKFQDRFISPSQKREGMVVAHGSTFTEQMNRLNALGFSITISADPRTKVTIEPVSVAIVTTNADKTLIFYDPYNDIKKSMDNILDFISANSGEGSVKTYALLTTDDPRIMDTIKLSKNGSLPSNARYRYYKAEFVKELRSTRIGSIEDIEPAPSGNPDGDGADPAIVKMATAARKYRTLPFVKYLRLVLTNVKGYMKPAGSLQDWYKYPSEVEGVSKESLDAIHSMWEKVSDKEIKASKEFKKLVKDVKDTVIGYNKVGRTVTLINMDYENLYKGRLEKQQFVNMIIQKATAEITKEAKAEPSLAALYFQGVPPSELKVTPKFTEKFIKDKFKGIL